MSREMIWDSSRNLVFKGETLEETQDYNNARDTAGKLLFGLAILQTLSWVVMFVTPIVTKKPKPQNTFENQRCRVIFILLTDLISHMVLPALLLVYVLTQLKGYSVDKAVFSTVLIYTILYSIYC
jgi:hypothetical protein